MITENTLRIKIETTGDGQLKASIDGTAASVAALDTAQQGATATTAQATVVQQETAAAMAAAGVAATDSAAAVARASAITGETYDQQTARLKAMLATSLEQQASNAAIAESETSLLERAGLRVEMTDAERAAILANAEATRAKVAADIKAIAAQEGVATATAATTAETEVQAAAFALNSRAMSEISTITSDVVSGQFGRIRRSLAALANASGAAGMLFSPLGLLAAAMAAVGVAALKGEEQESALNNAIIATGNYAGVTAGDLDAMAKSMAGGTVTIGQAREAIAALTESGRFTSDQIAKLGQATVDAGTLMGQSVKQTVAEFTRLQDSPVAASEKLNESTHYLTTTVLQQIVALQQQGDTIGAANLAMNTYADSLHTRVTDSVANLGLLERGWDSIKSSASLAWDAMEGIGRSTTINDKIAALQQQLVIESGTHLGQAQPLARFNVTAGHVGWESTGAGAAFGYDPVAKQIEQLKALEATQKELQDSAAQKAVSTSVQDAGDQAVQTLAKLGISLDGLKSKQDKVNEAAAAFYAIHLAGGKLPAGVNFDGPTADIPQGTGWDKIKAGLLSGHKKMALHNPEPNAYNTFSSQVGALDVKTITADDAALTQYEQGIARLADQMNVYMSKGGDATKAADLFNRGQKDLQKTLDANHAREITAENQYAAALDKTNAALQLQVNNEIARIGMGAKEYTQTQQINKAYQDEADALEKLALQRQAGVNGQSGGLSKSAYDADVQALKDATTQKVAIMQDGYRRMDAAQSDWTNGMRAAMQDYADQAKNVAAQVGQAFTTLSSDMENSLADWLTTGKLSFSSFEKDFENMLAHMVAKALIAKAETGLVNLVSMMPIGGGGLGTIGAGMADGGRVVGPGTGTSDSVMARLSNGENVITADATSHYGQQFMNDLNAMRLPRFAQGGLVGSSAGASGASGVMSSPQTTVNIYGAQDGARVEQRDNSNGQRIIDVFINAAAQDVARGGRLAQAMGSAFGVQRQARSYATAGG